tara:strand:+ start:397 stop:591 length:195 start_codon:yes stop_codon:yes gene_type:complete
MFDEWTMTTWLILLVDIVAVVIVVLFLKRKIQHKLEEVEARHAHKRLMKKQEKQDETPSPESPS